MPLIPSWYWIFKSPFAAPASACDTLVIASQNSWQAENVGAQGNFKGNDVFLPSLNDFFGELAERGLKSTSMLAFCDWCLFQVLWDVQKISETKAAHTNRKGGFFISTTICCNLSPLTSPWLNLRLHQKNLIAVPPKNKHVSPLNDLRKNIPLLQGSINLYSEIQQV